MKGSQGEKKVVVRGRGQSRRIKIGTKKISGKKGMMMMWVFCSLPISTGQVAVAEAASH